MSGQVFTYGERLIAAQDLLARIRPYNVDSVVDCRALGNGEQGRNTPLDELRATLRAHHIHYLPFWEHFGHYPAQVRDRRGRVSYDKATQSEAFLAGISRLMDGIQKGHTICIIDEEPATHESNRFKIIGRYLRDKCQVVHLTCRGGCDTHEAVEASLEARKARRRQQRHEAQRVGADGEEMASLFLIRNGYQILDRNWNLHRGCELDIVALKDNTLHFIEVKTRTSDKYGTPHSAINDQKMRHIQRAALAYRHKRKMTGMRFQVDSISIIYRAIDDYSLKHFLCIRMSGGACDGVVTYEKRPL